MIIYWIFRCCQTCDDVKQAYLKRQWAIKNLSLIKQCENVKSSETLKHAFLEGCQIYGYMEVNRVGGSFHISPGHSFSINHIHGEIFSFIIHRVDIKLSSQT